MAYVITRLCTDCLDMGCVEVCPVECIYEPAPGGSDGLAAMLYIHPTECISCGACEPECPWEAIYDDQEVPPLLAADIDLNALCEERPSRFRMARIERDEQGRAIRRAVPAPGEVRANKGRHGLH